MMTFLLSQCTNLVGKSKGLFKIFELESTLNPILSIDNKFLPLRVLF
jgi:hypothetical protein